MKKLLFLLLCLLAAPSAARPANQICPTPPTTDNSNKCASTAFVQTVASLISGSTGANPSVTAGAAAINGSALTFMRSDAAPAVQKGSSSQFGIMECDGTTVTCPGGVLTATAGAGAANPTATAGASAVNGSAATFMRSDAAPAVAKASNSVFGIIEVDNTTMTAAAGVISCATATTSQLGCNKPDNTTLGITTGALKINLANANGWTAAQRGTPVNIAISTATFTPNFNTGQNFEVDLTSACPCTLANPSTTLVAGQSGTIEIHQDGTGSRTIGTWGSAYQYGGGTSTITLSTTASAIDYVSYYVRNDATAIVLSTILKNPSH